MEDPKKMPENEEATPLRGAWEPPRILEQGKIEARLFSDEPDPFGGF